MKKEDDKMTLSLCTITKDEEENMESFLGHISEFADEIIIVDTGSTDRTKEVAKKYTDKVYDFQWCDDFSAARNFSLSKATKDWILVLDADERISGEDLKKMKGLAGDNKDSGVDGYKFVQRNYCNEEKPIKWRSSRGDKYKESKDFLGWHYRGIIRLFRNNKGIMFKYPIHETVLESIKEMKGKVIDSGISIHHFSCGKKKDELYYRLLQKKIKEFPTAHSFAEMAIHCFGMGKEDEGMIYKKEALKLNRDMQFLDRF